MPKFSTTLSPRVQRLHAARGTRPALHRRDTLRDLYLNGLISVFRQHSVLRVWEPLREAPRPPASYETVS